jgi:L-lactate dehydrogenase
MAGRQSGGVDAGAQGVMGQGAMRIGIIGMGWVGSSVAISILHRGIARELLLHDVKEGLAEGEAMDMRHGSSFYPDTRVRAASAEQMREADAVVVAAGKGRGDTGSRLDLARDNAAILRDIGGKLRGARGLIVVVTNPVDVLTGVMLEATGLPPERVLGTGTMLDTARLRETLGRDLGLAPRSVHAQVVGEHGDSEVVLWSSATVGGRALRDMSQWSEDKEGRVAEEVRNAAFEIIHRKGATNHAIGLVTANLLRWALRDERRVLTVSRLQREYGDVCFSLPCVVGAGGALETLEPRMDEKEREALARSADVLRRRGTPTA